MATRWIRQRTWSGCGPVALLNLLKWLGEPVTYAKDYNYWRDKCCCDREGTPLNCFVEALYSIEGIKIQPRSVPSIEVIDQALLSGRAVLMKSSQGLEDGHFFLVADRGPKHFFCVNGDGEHAWMTKAAFRSFWLQHYPYYCDECGVAPYAWIVRKI